MSSQCCANEPWTLFTDVIYTAASVWTEQDDLCWSHQLITFFFVNQYFNGSRYIKQHFQVCWPHCSEIAWPTWHLKSPAYTKWSLISLSSWHSNVNDVTGIILGMNSANHRSCYIATLSLIGWAHPQSDQRNWPCSYSAPAVFTKIIGHVGHFWLLGPNVWWDISQTWIEYISPSDKCLMNREVFREHWHQQSFPTRLAATLD